LADGRPARSPAPTLVGATNLVSERRGSIEPGRAGQIRAEVRASKGPDEMH